MNNNYMKVIDLLGEIVTSRELDISILKYENERLKKRIEELEEKIKKEVLK